MSLAPQYPIPDLRPPINWNTVSSNVPLYATRPSTPSGTSFLAPLWKYLSLLPFSIAAIEPIPRYTLYLRPWNNSKSPGASSHPANIEPIIHTFPPAAMAFTISPENLIPPSAIIGTPYSLATS